jgi:TonB family protein
MDSKIDKSTRNLSFVLLSSLFHVSAATVIVNMPAEQPLKREPIQFEIEASKGTQTETLTAPSKAIVPVEQPLPKVVAEQPKTVVETSPTEPLVVEEALQQAEAPELIEEAAPEESVITAEPVIAAEPIIAAEPVIAEQPAPVAPEPVAPMAQTDPVPAEGVGGTEPESTVTTSSFGIQEGVRSLEQLKQIPGNKRPRYDSEDRLKGRQGMVAFLAYISKDGRPTQFKLVQSSGHKNLDLKTLAAIKTWKFYPGQEGWVEIPIKWDLRGGPQEAPATLRRSYSKN